MTLFDCADVYGGRGAAEVLLGEALGVRRKDVVLLTKFGKKMDDAGRLMGGSRSYIISAVEASLKRLKTDWIDLYEMHDPDPKTPIEETLRALDDLVRQGKVRYLGCSHFCAWRPDGVYFWDWRFPPHCTEPRISNTMAQRPMVRIPCHRKRADGSRMVGQPIGARRLSIIGGY